MNARTDFPFRPLAAAAFVLAALAALAPAPSRAQCTYLSPPAWQTIEVPGAVGFGLVRGTSMKSSWTVLAVRPVAGEDWDLQLYPASALQPACVGGATLATSTYGGSVVDFVLGDGTTNAHTDVYPRWYRFSGAGQPRASWADSAITLVPDQSVAWNWFKPDTLVHVYQFALTAGVSYQIDFDQSGNSGGTIGATAHLFRNPGAGTYWAGRGGALASLTGPGSYTPTATGTYALVVCNDARAEGSYSLKVVTCQAPVALVSQAYQPVSGLTPAYSFTRGSARWGVVGVNADRYATPGVFATYTSGVAPPNCYTSHRLWLDHDFDYSGSSSYDLGVVNFDEAGSQPFYVALERWYAAGPNDGYQYIEWDAGSTTLSVDGVAQRGYLGAGSPGDAYDLYLVAGTTYRVSFVADLDWEYATPYLLLFQPDGSGFYGTTSALLKLTGSAEHTFVAPVTGWYGAIVTGPRQYNSGPYTLGFASAACPAPTLLADGVNTALPSPSGYARFDATEAWALFAVRGATTSDDWDLSASDSPTGGAPPACIGPALGSSNFGPTSLDFVALYRYRSYYDDPPTHWYARARRISAGSTAATMVATTPRPLAANAPTLVDTVEAGELAHGFQVYLDAGKTYTFEFTRLTAGLTVHLLGPAGFVTPGPHGFGRPAALVSAAGNFTYTPPANDFFVLVVANDNAAGGGYRLRYGTCDTPLPTAADQVLYCWYGTAVYAVQQTTPVWSVFGVRYGAADWDLAAAPGSSATWPSCLSGAGATSSLSTTNFTDFVVTDFHHVAPATWYAKPYQFAPAPFVETRAEWSPATAVLPNELYGPTWTMSANDVLRCHEVRLTAGVTYTITFEHDGAADLHLLMYRNPGAGAYWAGRSSSVVNLAPGGSATYVAPATDDYAIVVVDDDGVADTYRFAVTYCPTPAVLASTVPVTVEPEGFASFTPSSYFWNAVGVRGPGDWDLAVYGSASGGGSGTCFSTLRGASAGTLTADFVVGDFNAGANPLATQYVRAYRLDPAGPGALEWAMGTTVLSPGAAPASRTTGAGDVLEIWDANLVAGQPYNVYFHHTGEAAVKALVFANPGGAYWAPRSGAVWQGSGHGTFVPAQSGWHGVVVVNDNGLAGSYQIGFSQGGVAVEPQLPAVTALRGAAPNPTRGATTIEYALHEAAPVRLEVLDMAGRRVATLEDGERPPGTYRVPWSGGAAPPGLYFVRLQVAGRTVGEKKVALVQ